MKFLKLVVLVVVLATVVYGAWLLMFPPAPRVIVRPDVVPLYSEAGRDIRTAIQGFRNGWDDRRFAEACNALAHHGVTLTDGSAHALADTLANGVLFKLDSLIRLAFGRDFPPRHVGSVAEVADNYRGLDTLVRHFPNIGYSPAYRRLMRDRSVIDGTLAFGAASFVQPTQVTISMVPSGAGYSLDWNLRVRDYGPYRQRQEERRSELLAEYSECTDLARITWIPRKLARQALVERLDADYRRYLAAERRVLLDFLNRLPSDGRLTTPEMRSAIANADLVALETNIEAPLANGELIAAVHSAAAMLRTRQ